MWFAERLINKKTSIQASYEEEIRVKKAEELVVHENRLISGFRPGYSSLPPSSLTSLSYHHGHTKPLQGIQSLSQLVSRGPKDVIFLG